MEGSGGGGCVSTTQLSLTGAGHVGASSPSTASFNCCHTEPPAMDSGPTPPPSPLSSSLSSSGMFPAAALAQNADAAAARPDAPLGDTAPTVTPTTSKTACRNPHRPFNAASTCISLCVYTFPGNSAVAASKTALTLPKMAIVADRSMLRRIFTRMNFKGNLSLNLTGCFPSDFQRVVEWLSARAVVCGVWRCTHRRCRRKAAEKRHSCVECSLRWCCRSTPRLPTWRQPTTGNVTAAVRAKLAVAPTGCMNVAVAGRMLVQVCRPVQRRLSASGLATLAPASGLAPAAAGG